ncbi:hypothetical protein HanIR_Chr05g0225871 [Helianthus annuus]|nr:hypothetical protein HanIR_Chr05g0225871 [Helianthus annuus]
MNVYQESNTSGQAVPVIRIRKQELMQNNVKVHPSRSYKRISRASWSLLLQDLPEID